MGDELNALERQKDQLERLVGKGDKEPLDHDLVLCKENMGGKLGWDCIKYPLVFAVPYNPMMNAMLNEQLRQKRRIVEEAIKKKDWGHMIWMYERPYRFQALQNLWRDYKSSILPGQFWELFALCWVDTENMWQMMDVVHELWEDGPEKKSRYGHMMEEDELSFLDSLPEVFTAYRGHQSINVMGMSWTVSYWKACWFADRFQTGDGVVSEGIVNKKDVLGFFNGKGEWEIAVLPENVHDVVMCRPFRMSIRLSQLWERVEKEYKMDVNGYHGKRHWEKVDKNVSMMGAMKGSKENIKVCRLFAILHDAKRTTQGCCSDHGEEAVKWVEVNREELLGEWVSDDEFLLLKEAIAGHTRGELSFDPTIGCCWDADRMDLIRVETIPRREMFSTQAAKDKLWKL